MKENTCSDFVLTLPAAEVPSAPVDPRQAALARAEARSVFLRGKDRMLEFEIEGFRDAVSLFREAAELDPEFAPAYAALAETFSCWGFRRETMGKESQSYYEFAHEAAVRALELAPDLAYAHRAMSAALRSGARADPEARKKAAARAVELDPFDGIAHYERWRAFGCGLDDPSIYRAMALSAVFFTAQHDLGIALLNAGRLDQAIYHLQIAVEINPKTSMGHYNLAMAYQQRGLSREALATLRRAKALHPEDPLVQSGLEALSP